MNAIYFYQTCGACPEQYDAYLNGERVGYLRLRHGFFTVQVPDPMGTEVYSAEPEGDGLFAWHERDDYLQAAADAIGGHLGIEIDGYKMLVPADAGAEP